MLRLFEQFIHDCTAGKRVKPNGQPIKAVTIQNYRYTLQLLQQFGEHSGFDLRIHLANRLNSRELQVEKNYWKKFYRQFSDYLYKERGCFDNYVGNVVKNIRTFLGYLRKDRLMDIGEFYKQLYVKSEEVAIITLGPDQLQWLISNKTFADALPQALQGTREVFIVGCTVALRFSDLFNIRFRDIESMNGSHYLVVKSVKTATVTRVKLPAYAMDIINKRRGRKSPAAKIFSPISLNQFNKNLRSLTEAAGWVHELGKQRTRNGQTKEQVQQQTGKTYRFCDLVSSHIMRRTAVTTMLILGMPENVVRKISGHAANSKAFYRYVNFAQSYMDQEIDKVHDRLMRAS